MRIFLILFCCTIIFVIGGKFRFFFPSFVSKYFAVFDPEDALNCSTMESKDVTIKLRKKILCNYDKTVKPNKVGEPIKLSMEMILKSYDYVSSQTKKSISYF